MDELVIFVHIPKAAGTTLHTILDRQYPRRTVLRCDLQRPGALAELQGLDAGQRRALRCVKGHVPYGIHTLLGRSAAYLTVLRDPVARFLSEYDYLQTRPGLPERLGLDPARLRTPEEYLELAEARGGLNLQTRMLSGCVDLERPFGPHAPLPPDALDRARRHVGELFRGVGVMERMEESIVALQRAFGWRCAWFKARNVSTARGRRAPPAEALRARVAAGHALDAALYTCARERLDRDIAAAGEAFARDLRRLRFHNRWYGWLRSRFDAVNPGGGA